MFYIFAWCLKDEASFNEAVPLDLIAASFRRHGSKIPITVVFLEGFAAISRPYLDKLEADGLRFIDFTDGFRKILARFPNICARYSHYERTCFLRWIAFQEVHKNSGYAGQVWHLDGDVILHSSTDSIAKDTASKTFVLQGCPVLVSISDPEWFEIYGRELAKLDADIPGYSQLAHELKPSLTPRNQELCNVTAYRNPIGSDQDFLEYLVAAEILPQDKALAIFDSCFYFIQNPLVARYWDDLQAKGFTGEVVETENGELRYGTKRIPFIHYQNHFCHYCAVYLAFRKLGLERLTPYYIDPRQGGESAVRLRFRILSKLMRMLGWSIPTRRELILRLKTEGPDRSRSPLAGAINCINFRH